MISEDPNSSEPSTEPKRNWHPRLVLTALSALFLLGLGLHHRQGNRPQPVPETEPAAVQTAEAQAIVIPLPTPIPLWPSFTHPTPHRNWADTENPEIYQPTGSGRVASAGYGSIRTNSSGRASFHEGVDIAPVKKDRNGNALDKIFAVADGKVVYVNRIAGNSSYGIYIVIEHPDDVGEVYTIYAHLASVPREIRAGIPVKAGDEIAVMGNTSTLGIPKSRSHLHFEMGMMLNPDFDRWYKSKKMTPNHGRYHGFNFTGFNPMLLLNRLSGKKQVPFSYHEALKEVPVAWELVVRGTKRPRYFDKYPKLWQGGPHRGSAVLLKMSESGIPLSGRSATQEEIDALGTAKNKVLNVYTERLGRNGLRHVIPGRDGWKLGSNGIRWLEILYYNAQ